MRRLLPLLVLAACAAPAVWPDHLADLAAARARAERQLVSPATAAEGHLALTWLCLL